MILMRNDQNVNVVFLQSFEVYKYRVRFHFNNIKCAIHVCVCVCEEGN